MSKTLSQIQKRLLKAAESSNLEEAEQCVRLWRLANEIEIDSQNVSSRQRELDQELERLDGKIGQRGPLRRGMIEITEGAKKHGYLLVTDLLRKKVLDRNERLEVCVPATGDTFVTDIYRRNKYLRKRSPIQRFYEAAGLSVGDWVQLEEIAPGRWNLTKLNSPIPNHIPRSAPPSAQSVNRSV